MNIRSLFRGCFKFLSIKHLLLLTVVLCSSLAFSLDTKAQAVPPLECFDLDTFVNTELPDDSVTLFSSNPAAVNVLDNGSPGVLGGIRNITYGPMFNPSGFFARTALRIAQFPEGSLGNSNGVDGRSPYSILYNANGAGLNLDMSNTTSISLVLYDNDQPNTSLEFVITDSNNNSAQSIINNLPNRTQGDTRPADLDFIISEFNNIENVDLTDIQSIQMSSVVNNFGSDLLLLGTKICQPVTRDVPTLSQWGLIATALAIGLFGFMVMRRKQNDNI